jgi:16S rRNA (guanine(527)-N(7))-methyltransferase RsmG
MSQSPDRCLDAVGRWLGVDWTTSQRHQFEQYGAWLATEGRAIGGIGPGEQDRIWPRHVCDSLVFGRGLAKAGSLFDIGSGVGLPGIPLSIAYPHLEVTLVERSGRRADALHRIRTMLGGRQVIRQCDVDRMDGSADRVVFRASLSLQDAMTQGRRLVSPNGEIWFGLGRGTEPEALRRWRQEGAASQHKLRVDEVHVPAGILDSEVWLLRMMPT